MPATRCAPTPCRQQARGVWQGAGRLDADGALLGRVAKGLQGQRLQGQHEAPLPAIAAAEASPPLLLDLPPATAALNSRAPTTSLPACGLQVRKLEAVQTGPINRPKLPCVITQASAGSTELGSSRGGE